MKEKIKMCLGKLNFSMASNCRQTNNQIRMNTRLTGKNHRHFWGKRSDLRTDKVFIALNIKYLFSSMVNISFHQTNIEI